MMMTSPQSFQQKISNTVTMICAEAVQRPK